MAIVNSAKIKKKIYKYNKNNQLIPLRIRPDNQKFKLTVIYRKYISYYTQTVLSCDVINIACPSLSGQGNHPNLQETQAQATKSDINHYRINKIFPLIQLRIFNHASKLRPNLDLASMALARNVKQIRTWADLIN